MVDATVSHEMLSFLDAFSGYNQILMHLDEEKKTSFISKRCTYYYKRMPFGLKNAGATFQRLTDKIFSSMLGKTMEVYIDDMLVKFVNAKKHVEHLEECFNVLGKNGMKLNPTKCIFGVSSGNVLGFLVTQRGIEVSQEQVRAF